MDISQLLEQHDRARQLLLEGEDLFELEHHVASCSVCRPLAARLAELSRLIGDVPEPGPSLRALILGAGAGAAPVGRAHGRVEMLWPSVEDGSRELGTTVMPLLLVVEADRYASDPAHRMERFILVGRSPITVGRGPDMDVPIWDRSVSRRHARIEWRRTSWAMRDLESTNGTRVNGARLRTADVAHLAVGDRIEFGRCARMVVRGILPELDLAGVVREVHRLLAWATQSPDGPASGESDSDDLRARLVGLREETVRLRDQLSVIAKRVPDARAQASVYERLANMLALTESEVRP
jgi:hypothetical protein